jgi:hypothetical protein
MKRATASSTRARGYGGRGWMRIRALTDRSYSARQAASSGSPLVGVAAVGVGGAVPGLGAHADPSAARPPTTVARTGRARTRSEVTGTHRRERLKQEGWHCPIGLTRHVAIAVGGPTDGATATICTRVLAALLADLGRRFRQDM